MADDSITPVPPSGEGEASDAEDESWAAMKLRPRLTGIRFLLLSLTFAFAAPALAASPEQWEAVSTTAMSITGNVRFSPDRITFQNGKSLALAPAGTMMVTEGRESRPATLYRVVKPENPVLLRSNRLCDAPVTFIAVWRHQPFGGDVDPRDLIVYSGTGSPATGGGHSCATYSYRNHGVQECALMQSLKSERGAAPPFGRIFPLQRLP